MKIKTQNILEKIAEVIIGVSILTLVICLFIIVWTFPNTSHLVARILGTSTIMAILLGIILTI